MTIILHTKMVQFKIKDFQIQTFDILIVKLTFKCFSYGVMTISPSFTEIKLYMKNKTQSILLTRHHLRYVCRRNPLLQRTSPFSLTPPLLLAEASFSVAIKTFDHKLPLLTFKMSPIATVPTHNQTYRQTTLHIHNLGHAPVLR